MTYAHAYYASGFDKGGKTNYLETVTRAFWMVEMSSRVLMVRT